MKRLFLAAVMMMAAAACSTAKTGTGTLGTATDAGTDAKAAGDTAAAGDTPGTADTTATDVKTGDVGKDVKTKDVNNTPSPTWGECPESDQKCWQACLQSECGALITSCQGEPKCMGYITCLQSCAASPIVLPEGVTAVQAPDELTVTFCNRMCTIQGGPVAAASYQDLSNCAIGTCFDCDQLKPNSITKSQCQAICGALNNCTDSHDACIEDKDCKKFYGCLVLCNGEQECSKACQDGIPVASTKLFEDYQTCGTENATVCVAP